MPSVAFLTLGCKLNFAESSAMARSFRAMGFMRVHPGQDADVYVINTCAVTSHAEKKDRQAIHKLAKEHPNAVIAVTGCYAQLNPKGLLDIPGVDLVIGAGDKDKIHVLASGILSSGKSAFVKQSLVGDVYALTGMFPAYSSGDRTRSFLKVQDGCDYHCAYCTVPRARGNSRNIPIADVVAQAREIAATGMKEVVITGVNIGDFGKSTGECFFDLLKALDGVDGIERWRISSIEPNLLKPEIIAWLACHPRWMPHFHIPLQSGSDAVLTRMRRRYDTVLFRERMACIREYIADAFVGIDVIAGFPGEAAEDFEAEMRLLEEVAPAFLHIFPYSRRPGTPAVDEFPAAWHLPDAVREARAAALGALCKRLHRAFYLSQVGRTWDVLFESRCQGGGMQGYTPNYIRVMRPYEEGALGGIRAVTVTDADVAALGI